MNIKEDETTRRICRASFCNTNDYRIINHSLFIIHKSSILINTGINRSNIIFPIHKHGKKFLKH